MALQSVLLSEEGNNKNTHYGKGQLEMNYIFNQHINLIKPSVQKNENNRFTLMNKKKRGHDYV